jgi:hypothetical protein
VALRTDCRVVLAAVVIRCWTLVAKNNRKFLRKLHNVLLHELYRPSYIIRIREKEEGI